METSERSTFHIAWGRVQWLRSRKGYTKCSRTPESDCLATRSHCKTFRDVICCHYVVYEIKPRWKLHDGSYTTRREQGALAHSLLTLLSSQMPGSRKFGQCYHLATHSSRLTKPHLETWPLPTLQVSGCQLMLLVTLLGPRDTSGSLRILLKRRT